MGDALPTEGNESSATEHQGNEWLMTLLGLGLGPDTATVTAAVWSLVGCGSAASVCVARRLKADWVARQLSSEPLILRQPLTAKVPTMLTAGLVSPAARFPLWLVPYAQLLALGPFDARMRWTHATRACSGVECDGGWLPTAAAACRWLLMAEPMGTWGPTEADGTSPIAPWLEAGDETTDERVFWLTAFGLPLLLVWGHWLASGNDHTTFSAKVSCELVGCLSLPAWRALFMPVGGVCPLHNPPVDDAGSGALHHSGAVFSAAESIAAPRCWQRDRGQATLMAYVGTLVILPCWIYGLVFVSKSQTLWHGAGRSVYTSQATEAELAERGEAPPSPTDDEEGDEEEEAVASAHPLDRFPCRGEYAVYRTQLLALCCVLAIGLRGAGAGPPMLAVGKQHTQSAVACVYAFF